MPSLLFVASAVPLLARAQEPLDMIAFTAPLNIEFMSGPIAIRHRAGDRRAVLG